MFRLRWKKTPRDRLATIWMGASSPDRKRITQAVHRIEQLLRSDPENVGESRSGKIRVLHEAPLGVDYEVRPDENLVLVGRLWYY